MKRQTTVIEVNQTVHVTLKEEAFTPEFMKEFQELFYPFGSLLEHEMHIAQLVARGLMSDYITKSDFVEGYGLIHEFVKSVKVESVDTDVIKSLPEDELRDG